MGLGWFATCDIAAQTLVFDELSVLCIPWKEQFFGKKEMREYDVGLEAAVEAASEKVRGAFTELLGDSNRDKFICNCSMIPADDPLGVGVRSRAGIFLKCARLNHSCRCNAVRAIGENGCMSVVAQVPIRRGEQITISYTTDELQPSAARLAPLKDQFGFDCLCALCSSSPAAKKRSDRRRLHLRTLRDRFLTAGDMALFRQLLGELGDEGLSPHQLGNATLLKLMELRSPGFAAQAARSTPAQLDQKAADVFDVGTRVSLHKLTARAELNGRTGTIVSALDDATGRYGVRLDAAAEPVGPEASQAASQADHSAAAVLALKPLNLCVR